MRSPNVNVCSDRPRPERADGRAPVGGLEELRQHTDIQFRQTPAQQTDQAAEVRVRRRVQLMQAIVRSLIDGRANAARSEPFNCRRPAAAVPQRHSHLVPSILITRSGPSLPCFCCSARAQLIILYRAIVPRRNNAELTGGWSEIYERTKLIRPCH